MFKTIRIILLLLILAWVAQDQWRSQNRSRHWDKTLHIGIYPIAGDQHPDTQTYIQNLGRRDFEPIDAWFSKAVQPYRQPISMPMIIAVAQPLPVTSQPPPPPQQSGMLQTALWSLKMRWWAFRHDRIQGSPNIRLFVVYHHPDRQATVPHSLGLQKGQMGVIHAFATPTQAAQNNIVIAHELMHTLGATDKYDLATNLPIFPVGYANAKQNPPWPQSATEIMAGRRPINHREAVMPQSLNSVVIGEQTAHEIGLLR